MQNSDLFLELFDDDLLKPHNDIKVDEKGGEDLNQINISDSNINESNVKKIVRTDYDLNTALDKAKDETKKPIDNTNSVIHSGDTDSSEDEDNKYMDSYNYNDFGRDIKRMLCSKEDRNDSVTSHSDVESVLDEVKPSGAVQKCKSGSVDKPQKVCMTKQLSLPEKPPVKKGFDAYADPVFGLRIVNPLISSQGIQLRMSGKTPVLLSKLQSHLAKKVEVDFVVAGVIVRSITKQSQNDTQYMIWDVSDLKDDLLCVPVFIFGRSYKDLWKTQVGTVIAILNPTGGNKKGSTSDSFNISVRSADQVMIWGRSKDYGTCKSMKKNGEKCTSFVNKTRCEYCIYHIKKEYSKFSSNRFEIQSPTGNTRDMNFLRNKVLGKNEVFYGGKSFCSLKPPAVSEKAKEKAKKLNPKDQRRLSNLGFTTIDNKSAFKNQTISLPLAPRAALALKNLDMDNKILKSLSMARTTNNNLSSSQSPSGVTPTNKLIHETTNSPKLSDPDEDNAKDTLSSSKLKSDKNISSLTPPSKTSKKESTVLKNSISSKPTINTQPDPTKRPKLSDPNEDTKDSPLIKPNKLSLTNPQLDIVKVTKSLNNSNKDKSLVGKSKKNAIKSKESNNVKTEGKDLQTKFKSLLEVASGQKKRLNSSVNSIDNLFKPDVINNDFLKKSEIKKNTNGVESSSMPNKSDGEAVKSAEKTASITVQNNCTAASTQPLGVSNRSDVYRSPATTKLSKAKARALAFVKRNGPISKTEAANGLKKSSDPSKRKRERGDSDEGGENDKMVFSDLYMQLMKQTSSQQDLVESERLRMEEEYFEKMGLKEQLEEKMLNTFKIDCKAVKCMQCKYIWFSASDICKAERHILKIVDTVKRFFKCGNCGNRTVSLHMLPMFSCKNCQGSNWQRAPMMREKISKVDNQLSIRGGEQKFFNSHIGNSNLNLLVPE